MRFIVVVVAVVAVVLTVRWYASLPVLYRSWSTQECVTVIDPRGRYSCEHPPTIHLPAVWVR